jgi:hypothetical protein
MNWYKISTRMRQMRDIPMLDIDRERMRAEFEGFDDMTIEQFKAAALVRVAELANIVNMIREGEE